MKKLSSLRRWIDVLIYLSVALGLVLLLQLFFMVPLWLFYAVLAGWLAYVVVGVVAASGRQSAYPTALILAIITLFVSLPRPEHYALLGAGFLVAGITFLMGSALQLALVILIPIYLLKRRKIST